MDVTPRTVDAHFGQILDLTNQPNPAHTNFVATIPNHVAVVLDHVAVVLDLKDVAARVPPLGWIARDVEAAVAHRQLSVMLVPVTGRPLAVTVPEPVNDNGTLYGIN